MPCSSRESRWTRRGFLGLAGVAAGVFVARGSAARLPVSALGTAVTEGHAGTDLFVSRPDLVPPPVSVRSPAGRTSEGLIFVAPFQIGKPAAGATGQSGPLIVDNDGQPVWFEPMSKLTAMDLRMQKYRGSHVLTWYEGDVLGGYGGTYVIADASYRQVARVKAGDGEHGDLHEFLITSGNTALISIYREIDADLSSVGGPVAGKLVDGIVQELELPGGRVLFEWHSHDHVEVNESFFTMVTPAGNVDYFHLNSVGVDTDGHLLVSARNTSTVYKIDRKTGQVKWRLGGKRSDFTFAPGSAFNFQHDARRHSDGTMTIFDNGTSSPAGAAAGPPSRAIRIALDMRTMTASLVAAYSPADPRAGWAMGNVQQLPDGGAFVGWGTAGSFSEFDPDGGLRFDAGFGDGSVSYRAFRFPWVGRPLTRPAVAAEANPDGTLTVRTSWNGATEVDRWHVRTGRTGDSLRTVRTATRRGFETAITIPKTHGYVVVTAIDRAGKHLGESRPLRI